jgi:hypothetical protein
MNEHEIEKVATRVVELMNQGRDEHCLFTSEHRRRLHAFAEATTPEAAGTLGKVSRAIESTSNKLIALIIWTVTILILAFIGSMGWSKLAAFMPK